MNQSEIAEKAAREALLAFVKDAFHTDFIDEQLDAPILSEVAGIVERAIAESQVWISVKEKLPSENGWVLTAERMTSGTVNVRWYCISSDQQKKFWDLGRCKGEGDIDATYFVTHWKPLPDPPKGNENV